MNVLQPLKTIRHIATHRNNRMTASISMHRGNVKGYQGIGMQLASLENGSALAEGILSKYRFTRMNYLGSLMLEFYQQASGEESPQNWMQFWTDIHLSIRELFSPMQTVQGGRNQIVHHTDVTQVREHIQGESKQLLLQKPRSFFQTLHQRVDNQSISMRWNQDQSYVFESLNDVIRLHQNNSFDLNKRKFTGVYSSFYRTLQQISQTVSVFNRKQQAFLIQSNEHVMLPSLAATTIFHEENVAKAVMNRSWQVNNHWQLRSETEDEKSRLFEMNRSYSFTDVWKEMQYDTHTNEHSIWNVFSELINKQLFSRKPIHSQETVFLIQRDVIQRLRKRYSRFTKLIDTIRERLQSTITKAITNPFFRLELNNEYSSQNLWNEDISEQRLMTNKSMPVVENRMVNLFQHSLLRLKSMEWSDPLTAYFLKRESSFYNEMKEIRIDHIQSEVSAQSDNRLFQQLEHYFMRQSFMRVHAVRRTFQNMAVMTNQFWMERLLKNDTVQQEHEQTIVQSNWKTNLNHFSLQHMSKEMSVQTAFNQRYTFTQSLRPLQFFTASNQSVLEQVRKSWTSFLSNFSSTSVTKQELIEKKNRSINQTFVQFLQMVQDVWKKQDGDTWSNPVTNWYLQWQNQFFQRINMESLINQKKSNGIHIFKQSITTMMENVRFNQWVQKQLIQPLQKFMQMQSFQSQFTQQLDMREEKAMYQDGLFLQLVTQSPTFMNEGTAFSRATYFNEIANRFQIVKQLQEKVERIQKMIQVGKSSIVHQTSVQTGQTTLKLQQQQMLLSSQIFAPVQEWIQKGYEWFYRSTHFQSLATKIRSERESLIHSFQQLKETWSTRIKDQLKLVGIQLEHQTRLSQMIENQKIFEWYQLLQKTEVKKELQVQHTEWFQRIKQEMVERKETNSKAQTIVENFLLKHIETLIKRIESQESRQVKSIQKPTFIHVGLNEKEQNLIRVSEGTNQRSMTNVELIQHVRRTTSQVEEKREDRKTNQAIAYHRPNLEYYKPYREKRERKPNKPAITAREQEVHVQQKRNDMNESAINIDRLVDKIYREIQSRMSFDRQRQGF